MNRKLLWAVLAIGLTLVIAPLAMSLPTRASAGQRMMDGFQPIMQPDQVRTTAYYYNDVFVPLGKVTPMMSAASVQKFQGYLGGFKGMQPDAVKLVPPLAQTLHMTPAQVQAMMRNQLPSMAAMLQKPATDAARLRRSARHDGPERRHLLAGARWASALPTACHDDAGERGQLPAGQRPARFPAVLGLLHRPRHPSDPARLLRPLRQAPHQQVRVPPSRSADARMRGRRVRERLTELGLDYLVRQVPVERDGRVTLRQVTGTVTIPALVLEDGSTRRRGRHRRLGCGRCESAPRRRGRARREQLRPGPATRKRLDGGRGRKA